MLSFFPNKFDQSLKARTFMLQQHKLRIEPPSHKTRVKTQVQHDTHWFVNGNALLQIGQVRFRLHRSRLVAQSAWFNSLFERQMGFLQGNEFEDQKEIGQALASAQVVDGLDLFYLDYPDGPTATEFAELLTAMDKVMYVVKLCIR
ncbi:hypothetical protein GALMADRAFT_1156793 [Galerina marginata CBS 339.88]|uniref:BTB domain-containing protein n=1 Tax=Galerina marginata (strain CBS 339.88) TaxID=685588 RepID=A0A067S6N6_GALM3|nr:hypothetical protein GALMADRAFT_1156793 [Galerina marginata CBS 339.88]